MRRSIVLTMTIGLGIPVGASAGPPAPAQPAPTAQSATTPAPWANKFFLPDIASNREQTPPQVIVHSFGEVPHGTVCTHKFTVTNIYDVPMQITDVRKSCTCLDFVQMQKILQPNETAEFTVTMNTGKFVGFNAQTFFVTFGPKFVSTAVIRVQATSRTDVSINPGGVAFGTVSSGARASQSASIKYSGKSRDWKLTEVAPVQGPFEVKVTEVSRGGPLRGGVEYQVDVTLKPSATPGSVTEQLNIKTNDPTNPVLQVAVTANIAASLEVAPGKVRFDGVKVGESATQRVLIRAAKPFKVLGVEGAGQGVTVELAAGGTATPVQFVTVKFDPKQPGPVARQIRIRTDLDGSIAILPVEGEAQAK